MDMNFDEFNRKIAEIVRDINAAMYDLCMALQPAIQAINEWGRSLMLGRHKDEPISNFLERMERKERGRKRYLRQMNRGAK